MSPETAFGTVSMITLLLFVGATGKSAQIPLLRLAAGRDGRSDAGLRAHPCGDDGDGRRVHDWPQRGRCSATRRRR